MVKTISGTDRVPGLQAEPLGELGIAVVGTDLDGRIRTWNTAAALLYGRAAEEMLGTSVGSVRFSEGADLVAALLVSELVRVGRWKGELVTEDASGLPLRLDVRATVLVDDVGERVGLRLSCWMSVGGRGLSDEPTIAGRGYGLRTASPGSVPGSGISGKTDWLPPTR